MSSLVTGGGTSAAGTWIGTAGTIAGIGSSTTVKVVAGTRAGSTRTRASIPSTTIRNYFGIFSGSPGALSSIVTGGGAGAVTTASRAGSTITGIRSGTVGEFIAVAGT